MLLPGLQVNSFLSTKFPGGFVAVAIGIALGWFDILVCAYFAVITSSVFFPSSNPVVSLLLTLGSFGLPYLARPVGAIIPGAYADNADRKASLMLSIWPMFISAVMAFIPPIPLSGSSRRSASSPRAC